MPLKPEFLEIQDALLGCFCPCHGCIDNAIHSVAGLELRDECNQIMQRQGHPELNGKAKLTKGYNLPARYVLHTVGPIIGGRVTQQGSEGTGVLLSLLSGVGGTARVVQCRFLLYFYGEFHFPNKEAAETAVKTVTEFLQHNTTIRRVIFNVFKDIDKKIYRDLLGRISRLRQTLDEADAVVIGAGAGLSTSAGLTYPVSVSRKNFGDFIQKYGIQDMYSGGFYPFETLKNTGRGGAATLWSIVMKKAPKRSMRNYLSWSKTKTILC